MRLPRPYIPITARIAAAYRTANELGIRFPSSISRRVQLATILDRAFGDTEVELDHDPPLSQRAFNAKTGKYTPDANDPDFMVWRTADDHRIKTYTRGDGARRSDVSQQRYLKRVAARKKPRTKFKPRKTKHIRRSHAVSGHGEKT